MAKNDNLKDFLKDVADAIRDKKGTTDLINPQDFSAEIASIKSGGGAVVVSPKAINFRDYDGTILHSYTKDEFLALTELPPLPTREGLICQEWNWDFADAVEYVRGSGALEVGATYITDDGKTRLYITIAAEGRMDVSVYFYQGLANGVYIDWGDNSEIQTIGNSGAVIATHTYATIGDYCIKLDPSNTSTFYLGHSSTTYCVMGGVNSTKYIESNILKRVEMGNVSAEIMQYAFYNCRELESVSIPKDVLRINPRAFHTCRSLRYLCLPKKISTLFEELFNNCISLKTISINKSVKTLPASGFRNCYSLKRLVIPPDINKINSNCFYNCYVLSELIFGEDVIPSVYGSGLYCCYDLAKFPKWGGALYGSAFYSCRSLTSMKIASNVTEIASQEFYGCTSMAFYDFSALEAVPTLSNKNAFTGIPSDCKIIVPDALYDEWIAATNWSTYASYIIKKSEWDALNA